MTLDLRDPQSIAMWFKVAPKRHAEFLRWALRNEAYAQFWPAIEASRGLVK